MITQIETEFIPNELRQMVILRYYSKVPKILANIRRFVDYINLTKYAFYNIPIFFEVVEDGLVHFFESMEIFQKINELDHQREQKGKIRGAPATDFLLDNVTDADFPTNGVFVEIGGINVSTADIFPVIQKFFEPVGDAVQMELNAKGMVAVKARNLHSLKVFLNYLFGFFELVEEK